MFYSLIHRRAWLALCMLLWMPIHLLADETAKEIKIYFHDNAGDKISLYAWVTDKTGKSKVLTTDWDIPSTEDYPTVNIGGKTWNYKTFTGYSSVNIILRKHDKTSNKIIAQTVDIAGVTEDTYLVTSGSFKTDWSKKHSVMLFHDITRSEAEGKTINYEVRMKAGGATKKFFMTNVRNQEPNIHSINTSLFTIGIKDKDLPGNAGDKVDFYIAGSDDGQQYADGTTIIDQFRPHSADGFDFTRQTFTDKTKDYKTYVEYNNCLNTQNDYYFSLTKGAGVSYTICLNNSLVTDVKYGSNQDVTQEHDPNKPTGYDEHTTYGTRSVAVYTNQAIANDAKGYTLIGNFLKVNDPNTDNQDLNSDATWSPDNAQIRLPMERCIKFDAVVGEPGDIVYSRKLHKPASSMNTIFFNICPNTLLEDNSKKWGCTDDSNKYTTDKWNYIIRPQVQAGKDAIALNGCVEITPVKVKTNDEGIEVPVVINRSQAFNANVDDNNYSQFTVYFNATRSTYTIVPEESIDLIGSSVGMIDRNSGEWRQGQWENGERQYHYVRMARNTALDITTNAETAEKQTTKCWEYTGQFYHYDVAGGRGGANAAYGFRFLTNQTYVRNYIEDSWRPEHYTDAQKVENDENKAMQAVNTPYWNEVRLDPYNATDMNNPIMPYNPNGSPIYGGLGNERDEGMNIGFVLPTGIYTIRFWQTTDKSGKILKAWYTLGERITPPNPLPDNTDVYEELNCIRTFSSSVAYKRPDKMHVFIVDSYNNGQAHLKEIDYIPANTGVILAYKSADAEGMKKKADDLEFVGEADEADQKYIYEKFPSINFEEMHDAGAEIGMNYLMPSIASMTIETTEYADKATKTIAYRNYMFTAYKKKGDARYTLCFKRVITGKTSPNTAYLRLPAELCGGNQVTTNDEKIVGSSAQFPDYNPQNAKECYAAAIWGDSSTTGITTLPTDSSVSPTRPRTYFTLQGVQVSQPTAPGIYICQGKKIVVKQ